ncbi:hypothetical protein AVEN_80674-1 [Araneus ventricosus]|uniref:Uncharacterized protein n=1 Tax=Araneus ventricosus TaxID=182803 RepID=A0A4Y2QWC7_ARAVE|nr:hypothetical protein AVEN_80674-1 [Araneus ventricosus]
MDWRSHAPLRTGLFAAALWMTLFMRPKDWRPSSCSPKTSALFKLCVKDWYLHAPLRTGPLRCSPKTDPLHVPLRTGPSHDSPKDWPSSCAPKNS